jgi:hypothetical protein
MHRRLQTNDAFAKFLGQIISCRQGLDAPKELWSKIIKDGNESSFLLSLKAFLQKKLILNGRTPDKIHLVPNDENIAFLFPKENSKADLAMNYSKRHCHAINKIEETWVPN